MKRLGHTIILLELVLTSCSGFLDEVDKDKLIPSATEHYAAVLLKEFSYQQAFFRGVDFMTDNVAEYEYATENSRKYWKPIFTWQIEIELDEDGERIENNTAWADMYKDIAIANYVIEQIDEAAGSNAEHDFIKGEAYFIRGWSYLELVNLYGDPYRSENAKTGLGVPLRIDNGIEQTYNRANLEDSYKLIISDLTEARHLIEASGLVKTKYHPSVSACDLLLSRTYLYMQNWKEAEVFASEVIENNSLSRMENNVPFVTESCTDILYSSMLRMGSFESDLYESGWRVNNELIGLYDQEDIRLDAFFTKVKGKLGLVYYPKKRSSEFSSIGNNFLRVSEAYLNRAEARYHLQKEGAGEDIRSLLEARYRNKKHIVIASGEALLHQILLERRKELCFEGYHRWFDLRRMRQRPEIIHDFSLTDGDGNLQGKQRYTLFSDDVNYTLPIPMKERENNPLIRNNERYEKLPESM